MFGNMFGRGNPSGNQNGGSKPQGETSNNQNNSSQVQPPEDQFDPHRNIWDTPQSENPPRQTGDNARNTQQQQPQQRKSVSEVLRERAQSLSFGPEIGADDFAALTSESDETSFESLNNKFNSLGQNLYEHILGDTYRMLQGMQERIVQEIDNRISNTINTRDSIASLQEAIPEARDPNIQPIAEAVKAAFLRNGNDDAKANDMTKQFLRHAATQLAGSLDLDIVDNQANPGDSSFTRPRRNQQDIDWAAIMKGETERS